MAERHLRKCSTALFIREIQIKTTLRFQLTHVRMARTKNTDDNLYWRGCGVKGTLLHCWCECNSLHAVVQFDQHYLLEMLSCFQCVCLAVFNKKSGVQTLVLLWSLSRITANISSFHTPFHSLACFLTTPYCTIIVDKIP